MGLSDIKNKILAEATTKKDELLAQAGLKKREIMAGYEKKAKEYSGELIEAAKAEAEGSKKGIVIDAKLKVKNEVLRRKRDIMEGAFQNAVKWIYDGEDYGSYICDLVAKYSVTKDEEIIVGKDDRKLGYDWLNWVNGRLSSSFILSGEKGAFFGGVILKKGDIYKNITMETLLSEKREEMESHIAKILF